MKITKGQIIAITTGEYSDYCLRDHVRALRDFDAADEATRFKKEGDYKVSPEWSFDGEPDAYGSDDRFLAWAIRQQLIEPLQPGQVVELHISDYGRLDIGAEPTNDE